MLLRLRGGGDAEAREEERAVLWVKRNDQRAEIALTIDESAQRLEECAELVYAAKTVAQVTRAQEMYKREQQYYAHHVRLMRRFLEAWSDETCGH